MARGRRERSGGAMRRGPAARRGMSLVEILVVLVILVIGIFSIIRLLPHGFVSLNFTQHLTLANALAQHREDEMRKLRENLPDAIVALDPRRAPDPIRGAFYVEMPPEQLHVALPYSIPGYSGAPPDDPRFSDVNWMRRVLGEQVKVPPPTVGFASGETVSLYRVLFSPIHSVDPLTSPIHTGGSGAAFVALGVQAYSGTPYERVVFQNPPTPENRDDLLRLGDFGYGIQYDTATLHFNPMPYERAFRLQFSFRDPATGALMQAPPGLTISVPANQAQVSFASLTGGAEVEPGTDFLYRAFRRIDVAQPFSSDPYEFKVYDTVFGLLGFNPITARLPLPHQQGRGLTVRIDYDVDDWHIMREDVVVPAETTDGNSAGAQFHTVRLATGPIKRLGAMEETLNFIPGQPADQNTFEYQGLVRFYPDTPQRPGTPGIDVVIVDLETGLQIDSRTLQKPDSTAPPGTNNSNGEIDYETGVIHLREMVQFRLPDALGGGPAGSPMPVRGRHLRVYYRSDNDFAVASYKPFQNYFVQPALGQLQAQQYYRDYGGGFLLFHPMDTERTVAVDYSYLQRDPADPSNAAKWRRVVERGELHRIERPGSAFGPVAGCAGLGGFDPAGFAWVRLTHAEPDGCRGAGDANADPSVVPGSLEVLAIRGASFHTRVVWREAKRWRQRERTTLLTRDQTR